MPDLPSRPDLDQLRRQARDLLRAARAGDQEAAARIGAASGTLTLTSARLAVAREHGFPSWGRLKTEVEARTRDLAAKAAEFCEASINWGERAARMLAQTPEIAGHSLATALVLGDVARVRAEIELDPAAATRPDPRTGWTPLHAVCASRWHYLDPGRAPGLLATARLLLDAGADPGGRTSRPPGWTPLRCATASASTGVGNEAIMRLLLERGAIAEDSDLFLAGFSNDDHRSLRLLLARAPAAAAGAQQALAAPVSMKDVEAVRLMLEGGVDPRRYADDSTPPGRSAVYAAIGSDCPAELVELLLEHGADPDAAGPDGRSPYRLATSMGRADLTALLHRHGAGDAATGTERFLSACLRADRAGAQRLLAGDPGLLARLTDAERGTMVVVAAQRGDTEAIRLMLDLGADADTRGVGIDGGTVLHAAAYSGSAEVVRLLLDRGADIEARDTTWDSTPLGWAIVGSGERPRSNPRPDWAATVRILLQAGASTEGIELSPDNRKPPSPQVADILRAAGVPDRDTTARPPAAMS